MLDFYLWCTKPAQVAFRQTTNCFFRSLGLFSTLVYIYVHTHIRVNVWRYKSLYLYAHVSLYTRDHNYNHLKVLTPNKHEDMVWPTQKSSFLDWCINHSYRYWSQKHFIYTQNLALLDIDTVTHGHCARGRHLQRMLWPFTSIKSNKNSSLCCCLCFAHLFRWKTRLICFNLTIIKSWVAQDTDNHIYISANVIIIFN